jgi:DNA-binding NarL/FixJ family response regulator
MKILIVEDHPLYAQATRAEIERMLPNAQAVLADTLEVALAAVAEAAFDHILLDLDIPGAQGLSALQALQTAQPAARIAILSGEDAPPVMRRAFEQGAVGYIPKTLPTALFAGALRLLLEGGFYFPPTAALGSAPAPHRRDALSEREIEVLSHMTTGTNKEIARAMGLSPNTIKQHVATILRKLDAGTRAEALLKAVRQGLIRHG